MSNRLPDQKKLIPISEAAKFLGISIDTVRRWDKSGILHSERPDGKNRYFLLDELEKHKLGKPLSISEAARELGISAVTLRRLDTRGLIKPDRNSAGERVYSKESLKNFLESDYFLRKKPIEEKIPEPPEEEETAIDDNQEPRPRLRIPEFLAIATAMYLLLVTVGIGNIKLSAAKTSQPSPTPSVLSETETESPNPASPSSILSISKEIEQIQPKIIVTVKINDGGTSVNIQQKPTIDSEKIGQAKDGDTFEFISVDSDWYGVKLDTGSIGYISATYIEEGEPNN